MDTKRFKYFAAGTALTVMAGCAPEADDDRSSAQRAQYQQAEDRSSQGEQWSTGGQPERRSAGEDAGVTGFAALDLDGNGVLIEQEWPADPPGGLSFDQVDEDGSGTIEPAELRQHSQSE